MSSTRKMILFGVLFAVLLLACVGAFVAMMASVEPGTPSPDPGNGQTTPNGAKPKPDPNHPKAPEMIEAAKAGNLNEVKKCIESGVDVNAKVQQDRWHGHLKDKYTALAVAVHQGDTTMVKYLLDAGADTSYRHIDGSDLMQVAIAYGHREIIALLKAKGMTSKVMNQRGQTPLHICAGAQPGRRKVAMEQIAELLKEGADPNAKTGYGLTPLHNAVNAPKNREIITMLLDAGAKIENVTRDGTTVLNQAMRGGCPVNTMALVERLKKEDIPIHQKGCRGTLLHMAAERGMSDVIQSLVSLGADVNGKGRSGDTALHIAARASKVDCLQTLLRNGAKVNQRNDRKQTPLHVAATAENPKIAYLLLAASANPDLTDNEGRTPILIATKFRKWENAKHFLNAGADIAINRAELLRLASSTMPKDISEAITKEAMASSPKARELNVALCAAAISGNTMQAENLIKAGAAIDFRGRGGRAPIHHSVAHQRLAMLKLLLEKKVKVNIEDSHGKTPVYIACEGRSVEILNRLVAAGANVNHVSTMVGPPLHVAVRRGNKAMVTAMLEAKADPRAMNPESGRTALHVALYSRKPDMLEFLLSNGVSPSIQDGKGRDLFMAAMETGKISIAELLLKKGAKANVKDRQGRQAIHYAARSNYPKMIDLLMKQQCDINAQDAQGATPLHLAIISGKSECARLLMASGAKKDIKDKYGYTVKDLAWGQNGPIYGNVFGDAPYKQATGKDKDLLRSAQSGDVLSAARLLDEGASISARDFIGRLPIHFAAQSPFRDAKAKTKEEAEFRKTELLRFLIKKRKQDVHARSKYGMTPLHFAMTGNMPILAANVLIKAGADVNAVDVAGESVLFYAVRSKNLKLVELLLQNGAKATGTSRNTGRTPLAEAVAKSSYAIVQRIADEKAGDDFVDQQGNNLLHLAIDADVTTTLIKAGVKPDVRNNDGDTPLLLAARTRNLNRAKALIKGGADVNLQDREGRSALTEGSRLGIEWVQMLLDAGANPNLQDRLGTTALHSAAYKHPKSVAALLKAKASPTAQDREGKIPLFIAIEQNQFESVKLFLKDKELLKIRDFNGRNAVDYTESARSTHLDRAKEMIAYVVKAAKGVEK